MLHISVKAVSNIIILHNLPMMQQNQYMAHQVD